VLLALTAPAAAPAQRLPLPPDEQQVVNNAIDRGVAYLKRTQQKNGTWAQAHVTVHGKHPAGYATLPALTLLECGVPASDPMIQKAAQFLRSKAAKLDATYELSLAVLLLDRIGDPKDQALIQTFALRLMAGQSATGGWGYKCPLLSGAAQKELLTALRHLDPSPEDMPAAVREIGKKPGDLTPLAKVPGAGPLEKIATPAGAPSLTGSSHRGSPGESSSLSGGSLDESPSPPEPSASPPALGTDCLGLAFLEHNEPETPREAPPAKPEHKAGQGKSSKPYVLPERLRMLPVVQDPDTHLLQDPQGKPYNLVLTTTDNSNTQFAILALWTAQRHDVPMRRSLNLIVRRFATSQNADGSWGYHYRFGGGNDHRALTMTCVGLIGLAVGHGLAQPHPAGQPVQDQRIINGLFALSKTIGQLREPPRDLPMENLYYLWSLERVAVLYNLPIIGDKDWYRWGAQVLVSNQDVEGYWEHGGYVGNSPTIDTCLALLFLKRANLVKDLTDKLPFTPAELNLGIMKKMTPPSPKETTPTRKPVLPAEPPKAPEEDSFLTKPPPSLNGTAETEPVATSSEGSKKKWIIASLILFVAFAGGSLFLILFAVARRKEEGSDEKQGKRKKLKKKNKLQSAES
jgi:hypothetical protein